MSFKIVSLDNGPNEDSKGDGDNPTNLNLNPVGKALKINGNKEKITFDWLLANRLGEFGRYQKKFVCLFALPAIFCAIGTFAWVFLGARIPHRCAIDSETLENASYSELPFGHTFKSSFPWDDEKKQWSQCSKYNEKLDYRALHSDDSNHVEDKKYGELVQSGSKGHDLKTNASKTVVGCKEKYVFDRSQKRTSARAEFGLVCENEVWYTFVETIQKTGILLGSLFFGSMSDHAGRRPAFFLSISLLVVSGIFSAFASMYSVFVITRFFLGLALSGIFIVTFVSAIELVGDSYRVKTAMGIQMSFTLGYLLEDLLAYYIRDWRQLQLVFTLPAILFFTYYWFMPESIRWLLINCRNDEAIKCLRNMAASNGVTIPESELSRLNEMEKPKTAAMAWRKLLTYRSTMHRSLNIFACWFVVSGVYFGLTLNAGNLGGNDYFNFLLSSLVEIPVNLMLILTLDRYGRKIMLSSCMLLAGISLVACGFTPIEFPWLMIALNMTGKFFNAGAYSIIYVYSAELFPTVIRNSCIGISSMSARLGGILSDYLILGQSIWKPLPHVTFGAASLACGISVFWLPETLSKRLPETMEEAEQFGTSAYDAGQCFGNFEVLFEAAEDENYSNTFKREGENAEEDSPLLDDDSVLSI